MAAKPLIIAAIFCLGLLTGCSSPGGTVQLAPLNGERTLNQQFNQAYISQTKAGEMDVVLVDSAADWNYRKPSKNKPLQPIPLAPLRQVMHIHLYWRPLAGISQNPAAINASINWYILGPDGSRDLVVYEGAGYVAVDGSGNKRGISIRDGSLEPKILRGEMQDPVGASRVTGHAVANLSEARVKEFLTEMGERK